MAKFANSWDPDQTPRSAASDLGLHYLPITLLRVSRLQWVTGICLALWFACFDCLCFLTCAPSVGLFALFLGVIGRLCSVIVALSGHHLYTYL